MGKLTRRSLLRLPARVNVRGMLTAYEQRVLAAIRHWQAEPPGWGTRALSRPGAKVAQLVEVLVPTTALRAALEHADRLGPRPSPQPSILRAPGGRHRGG